MSQLSCASTSSTVPYEIIENHEPSFIKELSIVNDLYFENSSVSVQCEDSEFNVNDESDCESYFSDENVNDDDDDDCYYDAIDVQIEPTKHDDSEYIQFSKFQNDTCGCQLYGRPCSQILNERDVRNYRESCKEMTNSELDLIIKAQILSQRKSSSTMSNVETDTKRHKPKKRERSNQLYFFKGQRICRASFCFLHGISKSKLQRIAESVDKDGMCSRVHGNSNKLPSNSLSFEEKENIKNFISAYARDNALPLPGRLPNFKQGCVLLLPSDQGVYDIHLKYEEAAKLSGMRSISLKTFRRIWNDLCPHIALAKPATDLCQKCQVYANEISKGGRLDDDGKSKLLAEYDKHITATKIQRDFYRNQLSDSKTVYAGLTDLQRETG